MVDTLAVSDTRSTHWVNGTAQGMRWRTSVPLGSTYSRTSLGMMLMISIWFVWVSCSPFVLALQRS